MQPTIAMKFAQYVLWILLCKHYWRKHFLQLQRWDTEFWRLLFGTLCITRILLWICVLKLNCMSTIINMKGH